MYPTFTSVAAAKRSFRRTRTVQWFILDSATETKCRAACKHCGRALADGPPADATVTFGPEPKRASRGNRAAYFKGRVVLFHYVCSWNALLGKVFA